MENSTATQRKSCTFDETHVFLCILSRKFRIGVSIHLHPLNSLKYSVSFPATALGTGSDDNCSELLAI